MESKFTVIDTDKWVRKVTFEWFKDFTNPTLSFSAKVDVGEVIKYSKDTNTSFFINFLYIICRVNNEIESLRIRYVDNRVLLYERIDPAFTVKTTDGSFNNARFTYTSDYEEFYKRAKETINERNGLTDNTRSFNIEEYSVFYGSCITTLELEAFSEPLNANDRNSINVPRLFWDKYRLEDGKYVLLLTITASHALIDGEQLSSAFNLIKKYCLNIKQLLSK